MVHSLTGSYNSDQIKYAIGTSEASSKKEKDVTVQFIKNRKNENEKIRTELVLNGVINDIGAQRTNVTAKVVKIAMEYLGDNIRLHDFENARFYLRRVTITTEQLGMAHVRPMIEQLYGLLNTQPLNLPEIERQKAAMDPFFSQLFAYVDQLNSLDLLIASIP